MSPSLDMPLNRREAMTSLLAMLAFVMGVGSVEASEPREIPLETTYENGLPKSTDPLSIAASHATMERSEHEWRQAPLHDAADLSDRMSMEEVQATARDIWSRYKALECKACYGLGFHVNVRANTRTYSDCGACNGTGRRGGGR